ncbi:MAG: nitrate reductase molybdenum cofactor assembly chaperone [Thermoleophilaceae bacterium]|nr:nitrate reductase molybdenum cofactor assembly chaperone [Thermoleophilaceae bacterium]
MKRKRITAHENRVTAWSITSALLRYPDAELAAALPAIREATVAARLPEGDRVVRLIDGWLDRDLIELQTEYVEVFDMGRHSSLYLSWHQYGDRRQRGLVLLKLKRGFQEQGMSPTEDELPDWLPLMLEFAALAPDPVGADLLEKWRAAIELVRKALHDDGHPQAALLDLISATLPRIGSNVLEAVERLLAEGPPDEEVGLEPFGPDNEMPSSFLPTPEQFTPTGGRR